MQAACAVVVVVPTGFILGAMRRQTRIAERQTAIQEMLSALEWAPIVAAQFDEPYAPDGYRIRVKNTGRGPALNVEAHLHVRTEVKQWEHIEATADPKSLSPNGEGEATVDAELVAELRQDPPQILRGMSPRMNDIWVLHYRDILGGTWHTTSNLGDSGAHAPLESFRSWSPTHWARLPHETKAYCWTCLQEAQRAAEVG
jgi:hypothetical protein